MGAAQTTFCNHTNDIYRARMRGIEQSFARHADINMTRRLIEAGDKLAIKVHDHIIIGRNGHASFKSLKLI